MCGQKPCNPMTPACTWSRQHALSCEARWLLTMPKEFRTEYLDKPLVAGRAEDLKVAMLSEWGKRNAGI